MAATLGSLTVAAMASLVAIAYYHSPDEAPVASSWQSGPVEYLPPSMETEMIETPFPTMLETPTAMDEMSLLLTTEIVAAPTVTPSSTVTEPLGIEVVLETAGWPRDLWAQASAIAWCESRHHPDSVGDGGASLGLYQLNRLWFGYADEDVAQWSDPVINARVALATYRYDLARGQAPWTQWSCRRVL